MSETSNPSQNPDQRAGYVAATLIGLFTVGLFYGALLLFLGPAPALPPAEWPYLALTILVQFILAASPFYFLARTGVHSRAAWLTAITLTLIFWTALFVSVLVSLRDRTGVNIGMGWIMLLSPLLIGGGARLAAQLTRRP